MTAHVEDARTARASPARWGEGKNTALAIDDTKTILNCMVLLLKSCGCVVHTATNGEEALSALKERRYDVVISDHQMPVMTGLEFIVRYREWEMQNRTESPQRVYCVTGSDDDEEILALKECGMDVVLRKPYTKQMMQALVNHDIDTAIQISEAHSPN